MPFYYINFDQNGPPYKHLRDVHNPSDKDLRDQYHPEEFEMPWKAGLLNLRNTLYQRKETKLNTQSDYIKATLFT